ncbi:MAG: type II secretion system F family protein [Actinobacteria bacterium]|nr:type II secretion system F family protein [Actinomycetota bacterium]
MPSTFAYKVRDRSGKVISGAIEADSAQSVASKLRSMGYIVLEISEKKEAFSFSLSLRKKVKLKDLTVFARQFATMINSGVSITRALAILADQTENPTLVEVIKQLRKDVEAGLSLSEALAKQERIFPPIFINMARAGEAGGVLDEVLLRLAEHFEKDAAIKGKVKSALTYPVAVLVFSLLIATVMIVFVVPTFMNMFGSLGGNLPAATQMLVNLSNFIRSRWYIIIGVIAALVYAYRFINSTERGKYFFDSLKLRLPVFGALIKKMSLSKFSRTLSTLVASGVPILQALDIVADTAGNAVVSKSIKEARSSIKEGESISKPLSKSPVFPPMVVQMISVGEETGALDTMLKKIADFYDEEVEAMVESLTSLLEPLLMIFLGILIGGIVIALYLPMFSIISVMNQQG